MTGGRRGVRAVVAIALTLLAPFAVASPVSADSSSIPGQTCDGIEVLVDFGTLGGGVKTGCAPASAPNGLAAATDAGFGIGYVPRVPGMVCALNSLPDPCNGAPADAYWSYWHGQDGRWIYANEGAGTSQPHRNVVEGWAFGAGKPPNSAPDIALAATSAPADRTAGSWTPTLVATATAALLILLVWSRTGHRRPRRST